MPEEDNTASPHMGTRTRKPKAAPVERDLTARMFEVMALMRSRGPDSHNAK